MTCMALSIAAQALGLMHHVTTRLESCTGDAIPTAFRHDTIADLHTLSLPFLQVSHNRRVPMSAPNIGPVLRAWYRWKALRLPWRRRLLVGM